jgi:hypothetical protein
MRYIDIRFNFSIRLGFFVFHFFKDGDFACRHWRGFFKNYRVNKKDPDINKIEENWKDFRKKS